MFIHYQVWRKPILVTVQYISRQLTVLCRHISLQNWCVSFSWWTASTPSQSDDTEPWWPTTTNGGRGTVYCTWLVKWYKLFMHISDFTSSSSLPFRAHPIFCWQHASAKRGHPHSSVCDQPSWYGDLLLLHNPWCCQGELWVNTYAGVGMPLTMLSWSARLAD